MALFYAFNNHRQILTPVVFNTIIKRGAALPRFLIQLVDKEYHRYERGLLERSATTLVSSGILISFLNRGYEIYKEDIEITSDDNASFERLLYSIPSPVEEIKTLILNYGFTPTRKLCSTPLQDLIYKLSKLDISLIDHLVKNGLDLIPINDAVMEKVFRDVTDQEVFVSYIKHGFKLTDQTIKKGLLIPQPAPLTFLRACIDSKHLEELAHECMVDLLGPATRIFRAESADHLLLSFNFPTSVMDKAVLVQSGVSFPNTRSYLKTYPYSVWRWILRTYGVNHRYTGKVFDDAISRAGIRFVGDPELHSLHDVFLDAGVKFKPHHVKILACRLLHRDMSANALHLINVLKVQVLSTARQDTFIPVDTIKLWIRSFKTEVIDNDDWNNRMRTIQLEGGTLGGVYRINRPPEDGLKFLNESRDIVDELSKCLVNFDRVLNSDEGLLKRRMSTGSMLQAPPQAAPIINTVEVVLDENVKHKRKFSLIKSNVENTIKNHHDSNENKISSIQSGEISIKESK
ncbi:hypothetical protein HK099_000357, partial [Clydaea vesicula]